MFQGLPKPRFRSVKVQSEDFLKLLSISGSYQSLESIESKIRRCLSLGIHNCKKAVCKKYEEKFLYTFNQIIKVAITN